MISKRPLFFLFIWILCGSVSLNAQSLDAKLDPFQLYEVRILIDVPNWEKRLFAYRASKRLDKIPATVSFNGHVIDSVGVRFKGNSSFNRVKKTDGIKLPFTMKANEFIKGQKFLEGINNLKLSNGFRDPSYLRDVLSFYIAAHFMPAPQCAMAKVYVNDVYYGVYTLTEDIGKDFLKTHFDDHKGVFLKCDPEFTIKPTPGCPRPEHSNLAYLGNDIGCYRPNYELKSDTGWLSLIQMTKQLNQGKNLEGVLDIDKVLTMHAFNNVLVNLDSYLGRLCHNYYLYQPRDRPFVPLIWDLNLSFGGFTYLNESSLDHQSLMELSPFAQMDNPGRPLINHLLAQPLYRKIYLAKIEAILEMFFYNDKYKELIAKWVTLLKPAVALEKLGLYDLERFKLNVSKSVEVDDITIIGITELMDKRVAFFKSHPLFQLVKPKIFKPISERTEAEITISCQVASASRVYLYSREKAFGPYYVQEMSKVDHLTDDQGSHFVLVISQDRLFEYYIVAENEHRASLYPIEGAFKPILVAIPDLD